MVAARRENQRNLRPALTSYVPETIKKPLLAPEAQDDGEALGILREGLVMYRQLRRGELAKG
ncbi:MAG: hypothetical protein HKN10_02100 [Myxococcales bacterium]|nr:hypothetical protein [Myxococcales bacterium]